MEGDDVQCFGPFTQECCEEWCDNDTCGIQCREEAELDENQGAMNDEEWANYCSCECTGTDVVVEIPDIADICCEGTTETATFVLKIVESDKNTFAIKNEIPFIGEVPPCCIFDPLTEDSTDCCDASNFDFSNAPDFDMSLLPTLQF